MTKANLAIFEIERLFQQVWVLSSGWGMLLLGSIACLSEHLQLWNDALYEEISVKLSWTNSFKCYLTHDWRIRDIKIQCDFLTNTAKPWCTRISCLCQEQEAELKPRLWRWNEMLNSVVNLPSILTNRENTSLMKTTVLYLLVPDTWPTCHVHQDQLCTVGQKNPSITLCRTVILSGFFCLLSWLRKEISWNVQERMFVWNLSRWLLE